MTKPTVAITKTCFLKINVLGVEPNRFSTYYLDLTREGKNDGHLSLCICIDSNIRR